ncbi:hypothetical protein DXX93_05645 [Thalassotalea euphylliae]|uniref:Uncharacterized protein n=1 Tax=Thalassotalea euphylliae TaxID=1655234 RepID=A0A3E0TNG7_9GAMM|nr:hypothetical protein [Thalassotalea euphylliae]REL26109.1 hypothetical protein DXX93_05645 [Thalassotalea euphylliae]
MKELSLNIFSQPKLRARIVNMLCRYTGYYANNALYKFNFSDSNITLQEVNGSSFQPAVLIVAREYYQEKQLSYPIDNKKELTKLLALEFEGQTASSYQITAIGESTSKVSTWKFNQLTQLSHITPRFVLPESLLLSLNIHPHQVLAQDCLADNDVKSKKLFVSQHNGSSISSYLTPLINSPERFCNSIGKALASYETNELTRDIVVKHGTKELAANLVSGLIRLPFSNLSAFAQKQQSQQGIGELIKSLLLPGIGVFAVYLALTSAWLYWQNTALTEQIANQQGDVANALNVQSKYTERLAEAQELTSLIAAQDQKAMIWPVLATVIEDFDIRTIRFIKGRYVFLGRTHREKKNSNTDQKEKENVTLKSTDLLERLISHPEVVDAQFDSAVRRSKRYESFVVSFTLKPKEQSVAEITPIDKAKA